MYFLAISFSSNLRHLFKNRLIESKTVVLSEILQPSLSRKKTERSEWNVDIESQSQLYQDEAAKNKQWSVNSVNSMCKTTFRNKTKLRNEWIIAIVKVICNLNCIEIKIK